MALDLPGGLFKQEDVRESSTTGFEAGTGIQIEGGIISGVDASSAAKGIARFNATDFNDSTGDITLPTRTGHASCNGCAFKSLTPDTTDLSYATLSGIITNDSGGDIIIIASIQIPDHSEITQAIVWGTDGTWTLTETSSTGTTSEIASAAVGTPDDVSNHEVDNVIQNYNFTVTGFSDGESVYGGMIVYRSKYTDSAV